MQSVLPSISSEFQRSNEASWVGTSYLLATATFTPLYGRLSDAMGRRNANHAAVLFAAGGILACGCSSNMGMLVISRFISGIGGGGIFTVSGIITSDMYTLRTRGFLQSIGGAFYGLGMGLGGPIGGLITDWFGWRWAFLIQIPFFVLSLGLTFFNLHYTTPGNGRSALEILKRIDYTGSACLLVSIGSTLYFLTTRYNEGLETVMLSSATTAGLHLLPNSVCISIGSVFAGSYAKRQGDHNSTVALVASLPPSQLAIGTGFAQLVRGLGQVGGLAIASAIFQSRLNTELRARIHVPDAEETIKHIIHSARLLDELPPALQRIARDAYAASLKSVFTLAIPDADLDEGPPAENYSKVGDDSESGYDGDDESKATTIRRY
ncbi:hypothetical protein C0995_012296 [Termitomyces sp. Mi166|nr:hypothetical protein C0995_012296 [Termitomyces sp. Mi166\